MHEMFLPRYIRWSNRENQRIESAGTRPWTQTAGHSTTATPKWIAFVPQMKTSACTPDSHQRKSSWFSGNQFLPLPPGYSTGQGHRRWHLEHQAPITSCLSLMNASCSSAVLLLDSKKRYWHQYLMSVYPQSVKPSSHGQATCIKSLDHSLPGCLWSRRRPPCLTSFVIIVPT